MGHVVESSAPRHEGNTRSCSCFTYLWQMRIGWQDDRVRKLTGSESEAIELPLPQSFEGWTVTWNLISQQIPVAFVLSFFLFDLLRRPLGCRTTDSIKI